MPRYTFGDVVNPAQAAGYLRQANVNDAAVADERKQEAEARAFQTWLAQQAELDRLKQAEDVRSGTGKIEAYNAYLANRPDLQESLGLRQEAPIAEGQMG